MEKDQKTVIQIYITYLIAVVCNIIPSSIIQTFGLLLFIIIFIATYIYKSKAPEDTLIHSHMKFIIKSIWISSLILLAGMAAAYIFADHTIIYQTIESINKGIGYSEDQLNNIMMNYMKSNFIIFMVTLSPSLIYVTYRFIKGMLIAKKNLLILNIKSWV